LSDPRETAIVVLVPAAELAVAEHRTRFDIAASWGVDAHVTVLYPFRPAETIDHTTVAQLRGVIGRVDAFDCTFERTAWFDEDVLWLAPEPDGPFRALMTATWQAFPDCPPYGGEIEDVIPHLTIGTHPPASLAELGIAEQAVRQHLPIATRVDHVALIAGTNKPNSWRVLDTFPLRTPG
jgi:hypothetical protein